jgi:hypothetical protein
MVALDGVRSPEGAVSRLFPIPGPLAPLALLLTFGPWDDPMSAFTFTPVSSCTPVPAGDVRNALLASPKVSTILADDLTDKLTTARRQHLDSLR